LRITGADNPS
jgi:scytalone dehydratase